MLEKDHPLYGCTLRELRKEKYKLKNTVISDASALHKIEVISKTIEEKKKFRRRMFGIIISDIVIIFVIMDYFCK